MKFTNTKMINSESENCSCIKSMGIKVYIIILWTKWKYETVMMNTVTKWRGQDVEKWSVWLHSKNKL